MGNDYIQTQFVGIASKELHAINGRIHLRFTVASWRLKIVELEPRWFSVLNMTSRYAFLNLQLAKNLKRWST